MGIREPLEAPAPAPALAPAPEPALALDRASYELLLAEGASYDLDPIYAAIERADYDDAAVRTLARAKFGLLMPTDLLIEILVGVEHMGVFLAVAGHLGNALYPMLDLFREERFADDPFGADQAGYTAFVLWQLDRPEIVAPVLVPRLRRLLRRPELFVRAAGLIGWLAARLDDPHLTALFEEHYGKSGGAKLAETVGKLALDLWSATVDEVVAILPERAPEHPLPGVPIRAAPKVGRNELCPCGSGKKFKRCCADRPGAAPAGAGPSRAERLSALEPRLEPDQVELMSRADLARLDVTRLRDGTVIELLRRQSRLHDWHRASLVCDELARRHGQDHADGHLQDVIHLALQARHYDAAQRLLARLGPAASASASAGGLRLELALAARGPEALSQLEAAAVAAVAAPDELVTTELAYVALATVPSLGILLARGALGAANLLDGELLLEAIEEARDELGLPPGDPARELFAALGGVQEKKDDAAAAERTRLARTAAGVRAGLDEATDRLAALQRQVAEHEHELERAERAAAEASQRAARTAAQEQERRALRDKIEELQARIREGNEERGDLRRQLSAVTERGAEAPAPHEPPPRGPEPDGADDAGEDLPAGGAARSVQLPRFGAAAEAAFEEVPRNVAAVAMRTVGALAAGDPAAWRAVKQAKDMPRQVLMARVGIHHRLLFRAEGGLDVLDLVTRESLMTTLKRLRSA